MTKKKRKVHAQESSGEKFLAPCAVVTNFSSPCQNNWCASRNEGGWGRVHGCLSSSRGAGERARESCSLQLPSTPPPATTNPPPVTASDRHHTALISWPVTSDTHSRDLRSGSRGLPLQGAATLTHGALGICVTAFRTKDGTYCSLLALKPLPPLRPHAPPVRSCTQLPLLSSRRGFILLVLWTFPRRAWWHSAACCRRGDVERVTMALENQQKPEQPEQMPVNVVMVSWNVLQG